MSPTGALSAGGCDQRTQRAWEELPHVLGKGQKPGGPHARRVAAKRSYPSLRSGAAAESARLRQRRNGREELPCVRCRGGGAREELPRVWGQGRQLGGATPHPRSHGCAGTGGPRGAIPRWRSGRVAVRRYLSSKVRSSSCALLEQPWRDTPRPR